MNKKVFTLFLILLTSISIFSTSIEVNYNIPIDIETELKNSVRTALNRALSSRIVIDNDKKDILKVNVETLFYNSEKNNISLSINSSYKEKEFSFNIFTHDNLNKSDMLESIKTKFYDSYKYDSSNLFGEKNNINLNYYSSSIASFSFNNDNIPSLGSYYYFKNENGENIGLASINSIFENDAYLNILYNNGLTPGLNIEKAPFGMLSFSSSYDYQNENTYANINYTLLHSFFPFLDKANFSIGTGLAYDNGSKVILQNFSLGLVMDFPLSLVFNSESFFKNSGIRIGSFGGIHYQNGFKMDSKYSIGYYFYFLSNYNFEIYLEKNTLLFDQSATSSLNIGYKISILI